MSSISVPHRKVSLPTFSCMERSHNVRGRLQAMHRNGDVQDVTANDFFRSPSVKLFRKPIPVKNPAIGTRGDNGRLYKGKYPCLEMNLIFRSPGSVGNVNRHRVLQRVACQLTDPRQTFSYCRLKQMRGVHSGSGCLQPARGVIHRILAYTAYKQNQRPQENTASYGISDWLPLAGF